MVEVISKLAPKISNWHRIGGAPELTESDVAMALARMDDELSASMLRYKYSDDDTELLNVLSLFFGSVADLVRAKRWMLTDNLNEEYWLTICKVVLMEWRDPKVACSVCSGLEIRWHRALEQRYGIENPGHMDPIPCPACSGSNRKSWTNKSRHEAAGNTPNMKSFSSIWIPRIEDILQMAYDKESEAVGQFYRALNR